MNKSIDPERLKYLRVSVVADAFRQELLSHYQDCIDDECDINITAMNCLAITLGGQDE